MPDRGKESERIKIAFPFISIFVKILIFAALVAGTALALRPLQLSLLERMESGRDEFFRRAEEYWGRRIQYGSMGPSIFGALDIRDVRILREDDSVFLSISRLRLSYSFIALLRGNVIDSFHSMRLDRPVLSLDFEKDADLAERFTFTGGSQNANIPAQGLFPENFSLRIWNGEWDVYGRLGRFLLQGFELDASVQNGRVSFQGSWNASGALNGETSFETAMTARISGEYLYAREEGSATVVIPSFYGDYFTFNPLTISFFLSGGRLEARKTHDRLPAAISFVYNFEDGRLSGNFEGENFPLSDMFTFNGSWADHNPALAFRLSGNANIERERLGSPVYSMNFSGVLPGNSPAGQAYLAFRASGNGRNINIDNLELHYADGNLSFHGGMDLYELAPYGFLSLSNFSLNGGQGISGDFSIHTQGRETTLFSTNLTAADAALSVLDAYVYREEEGFAFVLSTESARMGTMLLEGSIDHNPRHMRATLALDSFPIGEILSFVDPLLPFPDELRGIRDMPYFARSVANDMYVTTEVFFTTYNQHILYNAPRLVVAYQGDMSDISMTASLSGTERRFDLSAGRVSWQTGNAEIFASAEFSNLDDISFILSTTHRDLTYYFEGIITDRRNIDVRGSYGFMLNLTSAPDGTHHGYAMGQNIPFPSGDRLASLSFLFSLYYASSSSWQAEIEDFEITGLATPSSPAASLRFHGLANETGMNISDIIFNDGRGALEGDISVGWNTYYSQYTFRADIHGNNRREQYIIDGTFQDGRLTLDFSGQGMQLARVSTQNAVADGSFRLSWESIRSFEAEAELSSFVLRRVTETITASASAGINQDTLTLNNVTIGYSGLRAAVPSLVISRAASRAQTEGMIRGNLFQNPVDISFRAQSAFSATETWLDVLRELDFLEGSLTVDTARYDTIEALEPFSFVFSSVRKDEGFSLNLTGGPRNMLRFRSTPGEDGASVFAALSAPSPVRGSITGLINSTTIDVHSPDLYVDMSSLWRFIPPNVPVAFPNGIVTASVRIAGSLTDPGFYGTARVTSVDIMVPDFIPVPIQPVVPVMFSLNGHEMVFGPVGANVGRGRGQASAWFRFERWVPNVFNLEINVPPETPIPYDFDIYGLLANGLASGRLNLAMEDDIFAITGDLTAHNTEISLDTFEMAAWDTQLASFDYSQQGGNIVTLVNLSIRTGRRVEFFWPSVSFPILQATADMGTGIHITSDSASGRFSLTGDVNLRTGELFYLERNFYIREGTLFFNENETSFEPRISARAEMRDIADIGPVIISMIIDNAPLMSFTPRFESTPPLSPIEIFSLLGHHTQDGEAPRNLAASAALDTLAQFTVVRRFQRRARDFLGLDMLSIRTQLIQNMVIQAAGAQPRDDAAIDRPYRVGNYFDNTTVFMGRYFGAAVFGHAMLSVRYDENRMNMGGLIMEPEIGFEMRNPLFDIRFNMVPLHPENWFIDDISVSLLWRRAF